MRFRATLESNGKTATGVTVPEEIVTGLGAGKRPAVKVTINGYTYRSSIATMWGRSMLGVAADTREKTGVAAGDEIDIDVELDTEVREVSVPADFTAALDGDAEAKRFFESLNYSNKRRLVLAIEGTKAADTRARRIATTVERLREGKA